MRLNPYLLFDGTCREAFAFYQENLDCRLAMMMTNRESPVAACTPEDQLDRVLHATLDFGSGHELMASDCPPDRYEKPRGFSVSYNVTTAKRARKVFDAMAEGGTITLPSAPTFWSPQFGMLVDRFGIPWMIGCDPDA